MKGIIEEGDEHVGEDYDDDDLRDAVIIGSAQRVEHYEIAAYGTAIAHARLLEQDDVVQLLEENLAEEKAADVKLTEIAESAVNLEAAREDESGQEDMPAVGRRRSSTSTSDVGGGGVPANLSRQAVEFQEHPIQVAIASPGRSGLSPRTTEARRNPLVFVLRVSVSPCLRGPSRAFRRTHELT